MGQGSPNGFGSSTTAEEASKGVDLTGKTIIVTGSNTGIGRESARVLALRGANVIMACRDTKKMDNAIKEMLEENKDLKLTGMALDLGDSKSIDAFVEAFLKLDLPLHILLNNAGVMGVKERWTTKDGFEYQIGINHLGHFRLTMKLLPLMVETAKKDKEGRIINVSSTGHTMGEKRILFEDIYMEKEGAYTPFKSYAQSKLANILFSYELNRRMEELNIPITVNCLHPGVIATELVRDLGYNETFMSIGMTLGSLFMKSIPQGAATSVFACAHPELKSKGGLYLSDCNIAESIPYSHDKDEQKKFFDFSEKETGVPFPELK
eukprot:gene3645-6461_t